MDEPVRVAAVRPSITDNFWYVQLSGFITIPDPYVVGGRQRVSQMWFPKETHPDRMAAYVAAVRAIQDRLD